MSELRIVIADDHEIVRRGLRALLDSQRGWKVCGEAQNGREAVGLCERLQPDVVVLDLTMPNLNGLEAARQIRSVCKNTEIVILTMHESEQVVREVLEAGARGYLLKSDAGRELLAAVDTVHRRTPYFTSKVASVVLEGFLKRGNGDGNGVRSPGMRLSSREREIVQLLAEGLSNKEVAASLGISVKTAETHRANILRKLGFHSLSELVRYAVRNRIIEA